VIVEVVREFKLGMKAKMKRKIRNKEEVKRGRERVVMRLASPV
jgi:hypothetical protein